MLAGVYEAAAADTRQYRVIPEHLGHEITNVSMTILEDGSQVEVLALVFDVASCTLKFSDNSGGAAWSLSIGAGGFAELKADDGLGYPSLLYRSTVPQSLRAPVSGDPELLAALGGLDVCREAMRGLTEEELRLAAEDTRITGPNEAPPRERPRALFVVAPSGGGKTTVLRTNAWRFDMKVDEAVFADSAAFRDRHGQYRALVENGKRNDGIWFNAWPAVKGVAVSSKKNIVETAKEAKKDLLMSDTGTEPDKLVKNMNGLIKQGYTVHFCGVFAAPQEIIARGVAREVGEGKRYNRSEKKLCQTFDAFVPAAGAANGKFCIVRNSSGKSPEVYMEGDGGAEISFSLEKGLAWAGPELTEAA